MNIVSPATYTGNLMVPSIIVVSPLNPVRGLKAELTYVASMPILAKVSLNIKFTELPVLTRMRVISQSPTIISSTSESLWDLSRPLVSAFVKVNDLLLLVLCGHF